MSWEFSPTFDASVAAAITGKKQLVYHCAPAWWATIVLFEQLGDPSGSGLRNLVVIPDGVGTAEGASCIGAASALDPIHPATGLTRTAKLLRDQRIRTLVVTAADALELLKRSALGLSDIDRVILGWPEIQLAQGVSDLLDTILAECRSAQRVLIASDLKPLTAFLEQHAHRAAIVDATDAAEASDRPIRYSLTSEQQLASTVRAALDVLNPTSTLLWDPVTARHERWEGIRCDPGVSVSADEGADRIDLALGVEVPTPAALAALERRAKQVLFLVEPWQISYLRALSPRVRSLRLPSEADRAPHRARQLRAAVRDRIAAGKHDFNLVALAPLLDEYDPATIAAAAAQLPTAEPATPPDIAAWVRLRINAGRDRIKTGDVVGVLLNSAGLTREQVGRVALRDHSATVEIRADVAERARRELDGTIVRGHRLSAKLDHR